MTVNLDAVCFGAQDPLGLARFWAGVLSRTPSDEPGGGVVLEPDRAPSLRIRFVDLPDEKLLQNRMHFDLTSSSLDDQQQTVARALDLGARRLDIGQGPDADHVVLADPEGNEFCVIEPGNRFLADTGRIGALACDGSQQVGNFWSRALDWPLVWDQGQETAVQSPLGGTKITWGGPPPMPRPERERLHLEVVPAPHETQVAAAERLVVLGATRLEPDGSSGRIVLADPDGTRFCLLTARP